VTIWQRCAKRDERHWKAVGPKRIEAQHAKGKLTARERLSVLLDEASFQELGALATHHNTDFGMDQHRYPGDGIITGFGKIQGRRVAVFAQDFTVLGGSFSEVQSQQDLPHPGPGDPEPASR
jgi:acetyl-CoA carboxylase carboxyltransferase component